MSEGVAAHGKMSKKCPTVIGRERSPLKNVQKMSHPYSVLEKMSKKCPSPLWAPGFPKKRNDRSHLDSLCHQQPSSFDTEKFNPMPPFQLEPPVLGRGPNERKSSAQCSAANQLHIHFYYLLC